MEIINEFFVFLRNNNILSTIIATVMSTHVTELTNSIADDLILPIIYRDGDGDGKADIKKLENYKLSLYGFKIKIGKFFVVLLKVLVIFVILFIVKKYLFLKETPNYGGFKSKSN
tara:strand:+ start:64 stop:408 length:345 start_codon:yes stop_codon:yes gene_type:complete